MDSEICKDPGPYNAAFIPQRGVKHQFPRKLTLDCDNLESWGWSMDLPFTFKGASGKRYTMKVKSVATIDGDPHSFALTLLCIDTQSLFSTTVRDYVPDEDDMLQSGDDDEFDDEFDEDDGLSESAPRGAVDLAEPSGPTNELTDQLLY